MQEFYINKSKGQFTNNGKLKEHMATLPDGRYLVTVKSSKIRSLQQNAYLHGLLIPEFKNALREAGYDEIKTDEQAKQLMKMMFLKRSIANKETGEVLEYTEDTHNLTTLELNILIEDVIRFCADKLSYVVPYPNEQLTMNIDTL